MNELLKINYEAEQPTVSARDLHEALGVASRFSRWFDSNKELFVEGEDYNKCTSSTVVNNGARRELEDYSMSVLMAKHICLMSRTEKGKRCRDYLIDIEKAWNTPEQIMARALKMANRSIESLKGRCKYALLDLKANKLERRLKKMLKQLLKVVLDEINQQNGTGYQISDVKFEFTRSIMMNESENIANEKTEADIQQVRINTILNMATQIGDEQTLKALCDVMDWDFDELKEQLKNADSHTAQDARTALGVILPDDPDNPDDEPVEE